jgi:hypothetical protein
MANVQKQFEKFHDIIRLGHFDENQTLRDKRDIIRTKLKNELPKVFEDAREVCPQFYFRNQGSYEMGTGAVPLDGDFDIDQGLYFQVSKDVYPDPVVLKQRVHTALDGHTNRVEIRRSCVTIFYHQDEEPVYHVDIAVYSDAECNIDKKHYLAKGMTSSTSDYRFWEQTNPQALIELIEARFVDNNRHQFRRIVRYLKRWKDENFDVSTNGAPIGIGLTIAAYNWLQNTYSDSFSATPDDLVALRKLVVQMLGCFSSVWDETEQTWVKRLVVKMPVEPWNDLFAKMTSQQMTNFEDKLNVLQETLDEASLELDPIEACLILKKVFGEDFPVPEKQETARKNPPAIVSSSNSAYTK